MLLLGCSGSSEAIRAQTHPRRVAAHHEVDRSAWPARRQRIAGWLPEVEQMVQRQVSEHEIPSLVVGLLVDGELLWWRGYGVRDLEQGGPVTAHTVYRIGSITKVITGMALLRLRDEGRLALDDPAERYLPELAQVRYPTRDSRPITLRQLLTHTSGLPRLGEFDYAKPRKKGVVEREVLESLRDLDLQYVPGTDHVYSNFGFALLGIIVGRVTGERYRDYVTRELLLPLGMGSTAWHHASVTSESLATGYAKENGRYVARHHWLLGHSEAMGGLYASLDDMVRFTAFHMTAWPPGARDDRPPLRNGSLRESHMVGGWQAPGGGGTGIGWGVTKLGDAGQLEFHTGATHQYAATVMFLPRERLGYVALTNCGQLSGPVDQLGGRMMAFLYRRLHPLKSILRADALVRDRSPWRPHSG